MGGASASVAPNMFPAKYTFDINATPSCSDDFAAFALNKAGSGAVAASQTGTFSGAPAGGQTVTITNGGNSMTLTASTPVAATATGTFTASGADADIRITNVSNVLILQAISLWDGSTNGCSSSTTGTYLTYKYLASYNTTEEATNLRNAINACNTSYPAVGVTATSSGANVYATAATPGSGGNSIAVGISSGSGFNWNGATYLSGGSDGDNTGSHFAYWSGSTALSNIAIASNLAAAINRGPSGVGVSANNNSSATVTVTATTPGIGGNSITLAKTLTNFAWVGSNLAGGADPQPSIIAINNLYSGPAEYASATGTFTGDGGASGNVTITNGANSITLTPSQLVAASGTGTFSDNSVTGGQTATVGAHCCPVHALVTIDN